MADFMLRGIPDDLVFQIKEFARDHGISLNQALLDILRRGIRPDSQQNRPLGEYQDPQDIAGLGGTWNGDEMQAFRAAIAAMEKIK